MVLHPVADLSAPDASPGTPTLPQWVVVGCGNLYRNDDGVGVRAVHQLRADWAAAMPPGLRLFDAGTGGMELMFQARGAHGLIIIDACRSGSPPGAIFRVPGSEIGSLHQPSFNLHDFRWDHAVHAGRRIFGAHFPSDLTVYLVEAADLGLGDELSAPVQGALIEVCRQVNEHIRAWVAGAGSGPRA